MVAARSRLCVARPFCGPPGAANGGFASGSLAAVLGGTVDAEAGTPAAGVELTVPDTPTPEEARAAAGRAAYYGDPLFPGCFVCGPARAPGDGLRSSPRPVLSRRTVWAAPWTPDPSAGGPEGQVRDEVVWAALDCPGGVVAVEAAALPAGTPVLLGQMMARLSTRPRIGTEYRMVAWLLGRDGRKLTAGSALLAPDGEILAAARALWITARPRTRRDEQPPGANVRTTAGGSG